MACGNDADSRQVPFSEMAMLKLKESHMVSDSKLIFFI